MKIIEELQKITDSIAKPESIAESKITIDDDDTIRLEIEKYGKLAPMDETEASEYIDKVILAISNEGHKVTFDGDGDGNFGRICLYEIEVGA